MKNFNEKEFVVFDVETTGLSPKQGDRVVELAAIKLKGVQEVDRFQSLLNPQRLIPHGAYMVHNISNDMVQDAPTFKDIADKFYQFADGACLIGHNIKFDMSFVNHEFLLAGLDPFEDRETLDTVRMARILLPEIGGYSLAKVSNYLGVDRVQIHRAMADVEMTVAVFKELCGVIQRQEMCREVDEMFTLFGTKKYDRDQNKIKVDRITQAIDEQVDLRLLYLGTNSGATVRKVKPQRLTGQGRNAVMIAYCHLRNEERNFKVERIVHIEEDILLT